MSVVQASECDLGTPFSNVVLEFEGSGVGTSSPDTNASDPPVKKQPRRWAAWTRQEEQSFFNALRQVGKNFERITNCVESKNKDQVRHYYYRLVRRMNKLLGPDLCLDAKNSKATISAMLRWWSLLEKYSCKPSKLHLKPRRYKLFVETLENQLLRDRKKCIRRCPSLSEQNSAVVPNSAPDHGRPSNPDSNESKEARADSRKIQKLGTGKGSSVKRDTIIGVGRGNRKPDLSVVKTTKQRRKTGVSPTAAYKKWEKAAIAGVSLVADAAEHLERTTDKEIENVDAGHVQKGMERHTEETHLLTSTSPTNVQGSVKLKLQLFPVDESIRRILEKDNHNPHLELTLSTRKKISSVMEHLNRKWGNSSVARGELMLLPYNYPNESLVSCQKWTKDCNLNALDIHALVGSPPVFRLRYGWFTNTVQGCDANMNNQIEPNVDFVSTSNQPTGDEREKPSELMKDQLLPMLDLQSGADNVSFLSVPRTDNDLDTEMRVIESLDTASSTGNWADSLTNISIGDLLSEAAEDEDANCTSSAIPFSCRSLEQTSFCSDSFDAAIAAHIYNYQGEHASSIWDVDETRDEFAFQNTSHLVENIQGVSIGEAPECKVQELHCHKEFLPDDPLDENFIRNPYADSSEKDLDGLTDIYWPDSLGPLDLDIPSCRYHNEDLVLSDSLGGLSRLIASSVDAFQSCSFFGLDKNEPTPIVEAHETAAVTDYKIGTEA